MTSLRAEFIGRLQLKGFTQRTIDNYVAAVALMYSGGLRLSECAMLKPSHIESKRMKIRAGDPATPRAFQYSNNDHLHACVLSHDR